jgi:hypothetical protein
MSTSLVFGQPYLKQCLLSPNVCTDCRVKSDEFKAFLIFSTFGIRDEPEVGGEADGRLASDAVLVHNVLPE